MICFEFRDSNFEIKEEVDKKQILIGIAIVLGLIILYFAWIGFSSLMYSARMSYGGVAVDSLGVQYSMSKDAALTPAPAMYSEGRSEVMINEETSLGETDDSSRMVIKTGSLSLVVEDVVASAKKVIEYAQSKNGWVTNSSVNEDELVPRGSVTVRVPAENFDEAVEHFRGLATKVKYETIQGRDITEEYVDLEARLDNLEVTEEQLRDLMSRSGKVSDILEVQRELTKVRAQIEQIEGRMQYLEKSVAMATITVNLALSEDLLPIPPTEKWQPVYILKRAWNSLLNSLRSISYLLIWLFVYAVIWLPIIVIIWLVVRLLKKKMQSM